MAWLEEGAVLLRRGRFWTVACCSGSGNSWLSSTTAVLFRVLLVDLAELLARLEDRVAVAIGQVRKDCGFAEGINDVGEFCCDNEKP